MKRNTHLRSLLFGAAIVLVLGLFGTVSAGVTPPDRTGAYIIVFNDGVDVPAAVPAVAQTYNLQTGFVYQHALKGMSAVVPNGRLTALQHDPRVAYVVEDMPRTIAAQDTPTGIRRIFADSNSNIGIDATDDYRVDVDVAVIDTGVDFEHYDLNVVGGVNCSGGGPFGGACSIGGDDDHYHGTHVAGTIAALDNGVGVVGVAPGARIWAVKVLDKRGSGYSSWIIAGIDWVAANADTIEVANMSLGGRGFSQGEYDAIQGAVNAGVAFAVAAGNDSDNASNYSPAAFDNALTVSALADFDGLAGGQSSPTCRVDQDDTLADFSNWGTAVDIAAPGVCIHSTYPLERGEYGTISGTSMASPHAAGALALLASRNNPNNDTDVYALYGQVISTGNFNWNDESGDGALEPLLDVSNSTVFNPILVPGGGGSGAGNPPNVSISSPAAGASFQSGELVTFTGSASDDEDGNLTDSLIWTSDQDGTIGSGGSFSRTLSDGPHEITASVADSAGYVASASLTVIISGGGSGTGDFSLSVNAYKVKGIQYADLSWSGATSTDVDIIRDGSTIATVANQGKYVDSTGLKGGGTATYQVCESGTSTCSNSVMVIW